LTKYIISIQARLIFKLTPQRAKAANQEHQEILAAFEQGRVHRAERLIIRQGEKILALLKRPQALQKVSFPRLRPSGG
jgi:DNA-binding GntR family transcriptional regulator